MLLRQFEVRFKYKVKIAEAIMYARYGEDTGLCKAPRKMGAVPSFHISRRGEVENSKCPDRQPG